MAQLPVTILRKLITLTSSDFQARVFLGALYLVFFAPAAVLTKLFSDPLRMKAKAVWVRKQSERPTLERTGRQF